jgi:hypothetical protein
MLVDTQLNACFAATGDGAVDVLSQRLTKCHEAIPLWYTPKRSTITSIKTYKIDVMVRCVV